MIRQSQFGQVILEIRVWHEQDPAIVLLGYCPKFTRFKYVHPSTQELRFEEVTVGEPSIAATNRFTDQKLAPSRHDCDDRSLVVLKSRRLLRQHVVTWHSGE